MYGGIGRFQSVYSHGSSYFLFVRLIYKWIHNMWFVEMDRLKGQKYRIRKKGSMPNKLTR